MTQYILLIQDNLTSTPTPGEWTGFFTAARQSGLFKGGSEMGARSRIGNLASAKSSDHVVGFMRFDSPDKQKVVDLLQKHPVVIHGGTVELCEMPKSP